MPESIIFYIVFISQIVLISLYYPYKVTNRMNEVINKYPPSIYPKLYPESLAKVEKDQKIYRLLNWGIALIGVILLVMVGLSPFEFQSGEKHAEGMPLFYGMLQFIPMILLEVSSSKQFKLMRKSNLSHTRSAALTPRKLFDYISPVTIVTAVVAYFGYIMFDLYINDFIWTSDIIVRTVSLTLCNILFIAIASRNLYGKKLDPFQDPKDRHKLIKFSVNSMAVVSIFASMFYIATIAIDWFELQHFEIVVNSLYFQILAIFGVGAILRSVKIEDINFDVYKNDAQSA
ncbi:hypothetical protein AAD001_06335 [Colwelliaceae bacterium 6471]